MNYYTGWDGNISHYYSLHRNTSTDNEAASSKQATFYIFDLYILRVALDTNQGRIILFYVIYRCIHTSHIV